MAVRTSVVTCVLAALAAGCGAVPPARWSPDEDRGADEAVVFLSSDCTAVVVGPRTLLTAAHCVEEGGPWAVGVGSEAVAVESCALHPRAYPEPRECGAGPGDTRLAHDLAVLTLATPLDAEPVPVLLAPPSIAAGWWDRRRVRLVGWDRRPRIVGPLARRSGTNRVVRVEVGTLVTEPESSEGFATIIGDSGGPALVRLEGRERVVGILRGGPGRGSAASVFAATFDPENSRWLADVLPEAQTCDLRSIDERSPFGDVTASTTTR